MSSNPVQAKPTTDKLQVAWNSVFITLILIAGKLIIGLMTDSLALLSQAADSGFDLVAMLITLFAVRISALPPDEDHPYGHGKFENLSALLQSLLLFGITIWIAYDAIGRLTGKSTAIVTVNVWSFTILLLSIALDLWRTRMLLKAGKEHHSQALEASALNFMTDIFSAVVAIIGLALVRFAHMNNADAWAGIVLSLFVAVLSVRLGKRAIDGLTDRYVNTEQYAKLRTSVGHIKGVEQVTRVRQRQAGAANFVELTIEIARVQPFATIQRILKEAETAVQQTIPDADVTVHWDAVKTATETPFESLRLITSRYGLSPHNVDLTRDSEGKISLDYHLEFPPNIDFESAHALGKAIEREVLEELPQLERITTHLEEERSDVSIVDVVNVTSQRQSMISEIELYSRIANREVKGVRNIELTESKLDKQKKLLLTLDLDPRISLAAAHDIVTNVEEELHKRFPEIHRIVIHAHPSGVESSVR